MVAKSEGSVLAFVAGGVVKGVGNKDLIIGINSTHFFKKTSKGADVEASPLPAPYVEPLTLGYDEDDQIIIGPVSHGMTVFLDVCKTNANLAAVTGTLRATLRPCYLALPPHHLATLLHCYLATSPPPQAPHIKK